MKLGLPRRRVWRAAIYIGALVLVVIAVDMGCVEMRRAIRPGFDTTRVTGPVLPDGTIDYLSVLEEPSASGATVQNNAAVLLLQALGRKGLPATQPADGVTDRLGMPALPEQGDYFQEYEEFCKARSAAPEDGPEFSTSPMTWPIVIKPVTAQWVKDSDKPLTLIVEASKRPRFFMPLFAGPRPETLLEAGLPYLHRLLHAKRALLIRAMMRLEAGDAAGCREDLLAVHRWGRLLAGGQTMVGWVVAMDFDTSASQADRVAAASGKLPVDQLRAVMDERAALPELFSMGDCVNVTERYLFLDTTQVLARAGPARAGKLLNAMVGPSIVQTTPFLYRFVPIPYEESMRRMNSFYDGAVAASRLRTYAQRWGALQRWEQEHAQPRGSLGALELLKPDWAAAVFLPALIKAEQKIDVAKMEDGLARVTLALAAFKAERGGYPPKLSELSPRFMRMVPDDLFNEKPLVYSRTDRGYTLYSVGPNIIDDGGNSAKRGDDIVASVP